MANIAGGVVFMGDIGTVIINTVNVANAPGTQPDAPAMTAEIQLSRLVARVRRHEMEMILRDEGGKFYIFLLFYLLLRLFDLKLLLLIL